MNLEALYVLLNELGNVVKTGLVILLAMLPIFNEQRTLVDYNYAKSFLRMQTDLRHTQQIRSCLSCHHPL